MRACSLLDAGAVTRFIVRPQYDRSTCNGLRRKLILNSWASLNVRFLRICEECRWQLLERRNIEIRLIVKQLRGTLPVSLHRPIRCGAHGRIGLHPSCPSETGGQLGSFYSKGKYLAVPETARARDRQEPKAVLLRLLSEEEAKSPRVPSPKES